MLVCLSGTIISPVLDFLLNLSHLDLIMQMCAVVMMMQSQTLNIQLTFAVVQEMTIRYVQNFKMEV